MGATFPVDGRLGCDAGLAAGFAAGFEPLLGLELGCVAGREGDFCAPPFTLLRLPPPEL